MPSEEFLFSGAKVGVAVGGGGHDGGEGGVNGRRYGVVVGQSNVEVVGWVNEDVDSVRSGFFVATHALT